MKTAVFIIAVFVNGNLQTEAAYPMPDLAACRQVASHRAILDSYPGRQRLCMEINTATGLPAGIKMPGTAATMQSPE